MNVRSKTLELWVPLYQDLLHRMTMKLLSDVMVLMVDGRNLCELGNSLLILEAYNLHSAGDMYCVWLSLTQMISGSTFSYSRSHDFVLNPVPNWIIAKGLSPPYIIPEEIYRKRELGIRNERGIKKIKIKIPSTKFASTSEPADKMPKVVLIPDHSSPKDQASHAPRKTLIQGDESSGDQGPKDQGNVIGVSVGKERGVLR
ncbi:unnamed protein product [Fraxinus pennsylvanica]|uniref:Uncharacterized protein n=1 Tax=Fraxinus pennsylvanica TaxID=56036 RepID=A0AAD1ZJI3_9LAMI|nr:unnamed protein product [Fraxinus pennsylvanica]